MLAVSTTVAIVMAVVMLAVMLGVVLVLLVLAARGLMPSRRASAPNGVPEQRR